MAINYTGKVTASAVYIRDDHNMSGNIVGMIYNGDTINITDKYGDWVYHDGKGWSATIDQTKLQLIEITDYGDSTEQKQDDSADKKSKDDSTAATFTTGLGEDGQDEISDESIDLMLKSARGIHGIPYQYMSTVDRRIGNMGFGRKYAEKIVANMPMLLITPGKPKFMRGYNNKDKSSLLTSLVGKDENTLQELMASKNGRFYSFDFNYDDYYAIVNPICRNLAVFMKIGDEKLDGKALKDYNWGSYANSALTNFISSKESVAFYIDSETQIQESFSNDTGESALSNKSNSMSDMARELQFVMGYGGKEFDKLKSENYDASIAELDKFTSKFSSLLPNGLMDKLKNGFMTVADGGKMIFPEIWNDSHFSRSYSVTIKLRSPDADKYSIYMNIFVPLLHLIALAAPQQLGPNGYKSPFLIRAYYKGFFNVDMGIITSLSITKGDKGKWTLDGLPTEIDISMDIKDLYEILSLTNEKNLIDTLANTAMLDYLGNLCGININKVDIKRNLELYFDMFTNGMVDKVTINRWQGIQNKISNTAKAIFGR